MSGNQYRVHISNQFNTNGIDSNAATLTVTSGPNFAPYARYYYDVSEVVPGTIKVTFNASDSYDLDGTIQSYSWDFGDTNADTGMEVTHTYSGNGDAYSVTVTVTDDKNVTDQQVQTVDVEVPNITTHPTNETIEEWQKATFSLEDGGTDLVRQWQVNDGSGWEDIPNAHADHYQTGYMMTADSGDQYRCIISNQYNETGVTSNTATLTVNSNAAPTIDTHPANASAGTGWKAKFWVVADGYGEIDYQWQYNTGAGWNDVTHASGTVISKEGSVTIPFWSADDAANSTQYRCIVDNDSGSATSNAATLTVTTPTTKSETWYVDGAGGSASYWPSQWSFEYDPAYVSAI